MGKETNLICVASNDQLRNKVQYQRLWIAVRNMKISRRCWLDELADCFRDYDGFLVWPDGEEYTLPDIDAAFSGDIDMRWFGLYISADSTGENPRTRTKKLERLRLFDLYFRIRYPHIADKFAL